MRTPMFYVAMAFAAYGALQTGVVIMRATSAAAPMAVPEPAPPVLTVQQFLEQPALREQVFARCANDPGGTRDDRDCINVRAAERVAMGGTGQIPQFIPKHGN